MYNGKEINKKEIAKPAPAKKPNPYKGDVIYDPMGQWRHPGQVTRIPGGNITMKDVPYPVLGIDDQGNEQLMMPGGNYNFPGALNVTEYPQMMYGGDPSLPSITGHYQKGGTKIHTDKAAYDKAHKAEMDSTYLYNNPMSIDYAIANGPMKLLRKRGIDPVMYSRQGDEFYANWAKPRIHNVYEEPVVEPVKVQSKKAETSKKDYTARNIDFSSPYGAVMKYYDELGQVIRTEPYDLPAKQSGGDVEKARAFLQDGSIYGHPLTQAQIEHFTRIAGPMDEEGEFEAIDEDLESDEEFLRRGGISPLQRMISPRSRTSKNIKTSVNKLFLRNFDLYGQSGRLIYDPNSKKQEGGEHMTFEDYIRSAPDFFNPEYLMQDGGFNSPTNYGSFPAMRMGGDMPCYNCGGAYMQVGGYNPIDNQGLYTTSNIPTPQQIQSAGFQSLDNEGRPIQGGLQWNPETGKTLKDSIIPPVANFQANGVQSPMMNAVTPSVNSMQFNTVNTNNAKRSFGVLGAKPNQMLNTNTGKLQNQKEGGSSDPGQSQDDIISEKKNVFMKYLQGNTQKALMKEMHEEIMNNFMRYGGLPQAQGGGHNLTDVEYEQYQQYLNSKKQASPYTQGSIPYTQSYNQNEGYTGMNRFPMNYRSSYMPGKKDFATMNSLSKDAKLQGFEMNYGMLGKLAPKMFGPKSIKYMFSDVNPATSQGPGVNLQDPNNPLYNPNGNTTTIQDIENLYRSSIADPKKAINQSIDPYQTMRYGGLPIAEEGIGTVLQKKSEPYIKLSGDSSTQSSQSFPTSFEAPIHPNAGDINNIEMKDYKQLPQDRVNKDITLNRKTNFNGEEIANWTMAGMEGLTSLFNNRDNRAAQDRLDMLQSGDNQYFATQGNRGDYDVNSGLFRQNQQVPIQYTGKNLQGNNGTVNYQEGGEYELTDEEIEAIRAAGGDIEFLD